jgi:predicted helicase
MPAKIYYHSLNDETRRQDKLDWLRNNTLQSIDFEQIMPDDRGTWINQTDNDFETLLPLASKEVKANKAGPEADQAVFKLFSTGIVTAKDEWIFDFSKKHLEDKMRFFAHFYNSLDKQNKNFDTTIKWSRNLKQRFERGNKEEFDKKRIQRINYRPYTPCFFYNSDLFIDEHGQLKDIFKKENIAIVFRNSSSNKDFHILPANTIYDLHFTGDSQAVPLYRYDDKGERVENITDWGVEQFKNQYPQLKEIPPSGVRGLIFHYVYAVLHNPAYRAKYEQNLKRDFPRIPFYDDFERWAAWGKALMDLHIGYETVVPFGLEVVHRAWVGEPEQKAMQKTVFNEVQEIEPLYKKNIVPKTKLKADKLAGIIELDEKTYLRGIPAEAWDYKLGNRSALEWVLDQYKESKPSDPTILEKFNTYRFADYKSQVIDLLQRVCTVSVETMKIVNCMQ